MAQKRRTAFRWRLRDAEAEMGVSAQTLAKRMIQLAENPGEDGKYSTKQICAAVFGDKEFEQTRRAKEQADRIAIDNAERRRQLIPVEDVLIIARRFGFAIRQKFLASSMDEEEKRVVLLEVARLEGADYSQLPDDDRE